MFILYSESDNSSICKPLWPSSAVSCFSNSYLPCGDLVLHGWSFICSCCWEFCFCFEAEFEGLSPRRICVCFYKDLGALPTGNTLPHFAVEVAWVIQVYKFQSQK